MSLLQRTTIAPARAGEPPRIGGLGPLGCAIAYRRDPASFLARVAAEAGPVFTLNMAGAHMTVVTDPELLRVFHRASEEALSARDAQADLGFQTTLGSPSVREGTDLHRRLLTHDLRSWGGDLFARQWSAVEEALGVEWEGALRGRTDVLTAARRVAIRTTLAVFVDPRLLDAHPGFLDRYLAFQERLESATAKAFTLPRRIAEPLVLGPVRREREALVAWIRPHLVTSGSRTPYLDALASGLGDDPGAERLTTVVLGLIFAAHKNPGIGAGQSLLMLLEHPEHLARVRVEVEGVSGSAAPWREPTPHLDRCMKETLRMTQHSIGAVRRVVGAPFELGAYRLPVGRYVAASHAVLGRSSAAWPEPSRFDPARFEEGSTGRGDLPDAFLPFSSGVHACPGQRAALSFMRAFVVTALRRSPTLDLAGAPPPLCFERATLAQRRGPVYVRA